MECLSATMSGGGVSEDCRTAAAANGKGKDADTCGHRQNRQ